MKALLIFALLTQLSLAEQRPNIVLIMADDMGYECLGANGSTSYKTPRLDQLAQQGMRFENCHAQAICTPSRVKLMSGKTNQLNYVDFATLHRGVRTFAHTFQAAGYQTAVAGKWQLDSTEDSPLHFGFDEALLWQHSAPRLKLPVNGEAKKRDSRYASPWLQSTHRREDGKVATKLQHHPGKYGPDLLSEFCLDFIERNQDRPFLLYYPMLLVHCPFTPTPDSPNWVPGDPGSADYKGDPDNFPAMVAYTDKIVGKITDKLDALRLSENTLIIFTGDNGTDKPIGSKMGDATVIGSKGKTIKWGTNVPLIARWKGHIPAASTNRDLLDFSDFFPTFCEIAGIPIPSENGLTGQSFAPQLLGKKGTPREALYYWSKVRATVKKPTIFAHTQRYKLYSNNTFFDLKTDVQEKSPIPKSQRSAEQKEIIKTLSAVIKKHASLKHQFPKQ